MYIYTNTFHCFNYCTRCFEKVTNMVHRESSRLKRLDTGCDRDETALRQEQRYGDYILSQCFSYLGMLYSTLGNFVLLIFQIP